MGYLVRGEPAPGRPEGALAPDPSLPRACVIGAGSCGIAAAKALYEARVPFDCFEAGPVLGGLWEFENPNGLSGAYSTLEMNTSGPRMSLLGLPARRRRLPAARVGRRLLRALRRPLRHPRHDHLQHRGRARRAARRRLRTCRRSPGEEPRAARDARATTRSWSATATTGIRAGPSRRSRASSPAARCTRTTTGVPEQLAGKRVVVVGGGNSGMDIARDAADHGRGRLPVAAPRRARDPQAARPQAQADRSDAAAAVAAVAAQAEGVRAAAPALGRHHRLRLSRARPQGRPRASDRLGRDPRPARRRRGGRRSRTSASCAATGWCSRTAPRSRPT